jgi:hypothetical protein
MKRKNRAARWLLFFFTLLLLGVFYLGSYFFALLLGHFFIFVFYGTAAAALYQLFQLVIAIPASEMAEAEGLE